jgi:hypothetical protein
LVTPHVGEQVRGAVRRDVLQSICAVNCAGSGAASVAGPPAMRARDKGAIMHGQKAVMRCQRRQRASRAPAWTAAKLIAGEGAGPQSTAAGPMPFAAARATWEMFEEEGRRSRPTQSPVSIRRLRRKART